MTTPAENKGFVVNKTRLALLGDDGEYSAQQKSQVWVLKTDDGSNCPYFIKESELGSSEHTDTLCAYVRDMEVILGRFEPKEGNRNSPFEVVSKEPISTEDGFCGKQVNGSTYHVYSRYWNWIEGRDAGMQQEATASAGQVDPTSPQAVPVVPSPYTPLQQQAINTFQSMYDDAVRYRNDGTTRLNADYGICDNIERYAERAGARAGHMAEIKENLIRATAIYSGDYTYPVPCPEGGSASNAFCRGGNKWKGAYGLNRLTQLGQLIELIKSDRWSDDLIKRMSPAQRNNLQVGDLVRYTRRDEPSFWVFRRDDDSMSPSFYRLGNVDDYADLDLNHVVKVDREEMFKERPVSEFLSVIAEKSSQAEELKAQMEQLKKQLKAVNDEIAILDFGLGEQHKVKRI